MFDVSCHCEERIDEAILMMRDCFGLDALAMTTVGHAMLFIAHWYEPTAVLAGSILAKKNCLAYRL
jgi:hypothetical protein